MNLKSRIKKISDALRAQAEETNNAPFLTLDQWKRRASGEDITPEIPPHKRAEFDEYERRADERVRQAAEIYFKHNPELLNV